jgi:hypothetical protein
MNHHPTKRSRLSRFLAAGHSCSRIRVPRPRLLLVEPLEPRCLLDGLGLLPPAYGWTQTLGGSGFDAAVAVEQDTAGNVYIAGFFEGTVDFDPSPEKAEWRTSKGSRDIFVSKFSAVGQHVWTWSAGGTQPDEPHGLCLSPTGEVLITGEYRLTVAFDSRGSGDEHTAAGGSDVFVTKLSADGQHLWTRTFGGPDFETARGVAVDSQGRVIVAGDFRSTVNFDPGGQGDSRTSLGQKDVFLTRLASDGSYLGTFQYGGTSTDLAAGVSVDAQDNIALAGMYVGSVDFDPTSGQDVHESNGYYDVFVTRITSAGGYGGTYTFGGEQDEEVTALAHDTDGNIYVTGGYESTVAFGDQDIHTSQGGFDIFVTRLNADGTYGWTRGMGGPSTEFGRGLALGPPDELFVVGSFAGSVNFDLPGCGAVRTAVGKDDVFVARLGRDGAFRGVWTVGGAGTDIAYDVVADDAVTIVGYFQNSMDFDPTDATDVRFSLGSADAFVSRFLEPGEPGGELGNRVWHDTNADGQWQAGEPGLPDVPVRLYQSDGAGGGLTLIASTVSDADGFYRFSAVTPGDYVIEFETPAGYAPTLYRWGGDPMWDSDASWTDGRTGVIALVAGESQLDWDAGYLPDTVAVLGGRAWDDVDGNGLQDMGEGNVSAVAVTLMFDEYTTVDTTVTAADGRYAFTGMDPGEYYLRLTPPGGYSFTKPDVGDDDTLDSDVDPATRRIDSVVVAAGTRDLTWDAGILRYDYGDAPDPTYPTLRASGGAVHRIVPGIYLGTGIDGDPDGQPDPRALGDDVGDGSDDEDGIVFTSAIVPGSEASLQVLASWEGRLDAWIDFGRDGSWAEPDDRIFAFQPLMPGVNELTFYVPASAVLGESYARFRYSKAGVEAYTGFATDGEVEDYQVVIEALDWGDAPDAPNVPLVTPLSVPDIEDWQHFGSSTATHGDWIFVGADFDGEGAYPSGAVYVYRRSASGWVLDQKLTPADPRDVYRFGASVSVWGDWAAIGTAGFVGLGASDAAFLFQWDGTRWVEREKLTATDAGSDAAFGACVGLHDDLLLVGAPRAEVDGVSKGAAYVFRFDGAAWNREAKLTAGDASFDDRFGTAVAGRGDGVIVGAPNEDTRGEDAGAVYMFHRDGALWLERQKIFGSEIVANDRFGGMQEIAFDGNRLLIGAPRQYMHASGSAGAAYVFEYDGSHWTETQRLTAAAPEPGDRFGDSVALSGDFVLVAASGTGRVSLLRWDGEAWEEHRTVTLPAEDLTRERGPALSLFGNRAVVGDPDETRLGLMRAGGAYVYRFPVNPTNYPTLFINNGARHTYVPDFYLGAGVDWEGNGLVHPMAEGDDRTGWDDEDGVSVSVLVPGGSATAQVTASAPGYLNAWIDFNADGDWDDEGEQIFAGQLLDAGVNELSFSVPDWATPVLKDTPAFARFRFSSVQFLPYDGPAPDGEVEDYALEILEAHGRITGRLFDDINLDRMPGLGESGLDGWRIELIDPETRERIAVETSRSMDRNGDGEIDPVTESGWYEFTGVPIGKFELRQIPPLPSVPPVNPGDQDPPGDPGGNPPGDTTVVELTASDLQGLAGSVRFPSPILLDIEAGDESWTQVIVPGSDGLNGNPGTPAVPVFRRLIALPLGVEAKDVTVDLGQGPSVAKTFTGVHLYPFQPSPVDGAVPDDLYRDWPFVKDAAAYASQTPWPAELVRVTGLGGLRGMNLALLEVAAAQYTPSLQHLVVFDRVDWSLHFPGPANQEAHGFLTERERGPFENPTELYATVLNAAAVFEHIVPGGGGAASCLGFEYLILTHPDFREAADRLAEWKNTKGIGTKVHPVGAGTRLDTPEEIRDYIRAHYDLCTVRPSYVLLMGDTEFIPTWYVDYHSPSEEMDQSHAFGAWRSIGSYHFSGTPGEQITLTRQTHYRSDPDDVGTVADAVRLVNMATGATVTVDNLDPGFSTDGTWTESPAGNAFNGSALISTTDGDTAAWRVDLPGEGVYEVFVWYSGEPAAGSSSSYAFDSKARYTIVGGTLGSDVPYALMDRPFDLLPDLAIGRIPVDTLAEAQAVVDKTIDYERRPPWDLSFYSNVSVVGLFQGFRSGDPLGRDQRSFIEESEHTRDTLLANGYQVQRIYAISDEDPGDGNDTPLRYYDGRDLPSALDGASGFAWNGDNWDIRNALLDGRFLVTYRAHGSAYGWAHPRLEAPTGAVGLTPVVYSITCESGLFDNESSGSTRWASGVHPGGVYFAESWLREPDRGAVGVIAATRVSPTWANSMLLRGLIDATWPDNDPSYGRSASLRRLGDILSYGKQYLIANIGTTYGGPYAEVSTSAALRNLYMYHVLGDPTLEMWIETPRHMLFEATIGFDFTSGTSKDPPDHAIAPATPTGMRVVYPIDGAVITAYQQSDDQWIPLGRGTIDQQHAFLSFVADTLPDVPIQVVASLPGAISVPLITRESWKSATGQLGPVPVEITAPDQVVTIHFGNYQPAVVSGQVWEDRNGDGQRDEQAAGLDGVTVELLDKDTGQVVARSITRSQDLDQDGIIQPAAESGWFSFPDLGQGHYQVRIVSPDGAEPTSPPDHAIHTFSVTFSGQTPILADFGFHWKDSDGDGVPDAIEDAAPFGGDGNQDNMPDRDQEYVVSLPNFTTGRHVTLVAPATTRFESVRTTRNPSLDDSPQAMMFEEGFLEFVLVDVLPGQSVQLVLLADQWLPFNTYYQYGRLPDGSEPTWYRFLHNGGTGAEILADRIILHLTDGGPGDGDLTENGRITVLGAPGVSEHPTPWQNPKSPFDVTDDGVISPLDVLTLINEINLHDARLLPVPPVPPHLPIAYFDVTGDNEVTPLDVLAVINDLNAFGPRPVGEGESAVASGSDALKSTTADSPLEDEAARSTLAAWLAAAATRPGDSGSILTPERVRSAGVDGTVRSDPSIAASSPMDAWRRPSADGETHPPTKRRAAEVDACFEDERLGSLGSLWADLVHTIGVSLGSEPEPGVRSGLHE